MHLVLNSIRYIPRKGWSRFTKDLKAIYGAVNVRQARERFEQFQKVWVSYPGAVAVWQQLHACRATVFLRQRRAQGHVYDERNRGRELQLPQSHEEGFFPERGCCVQAAVLTGAGALPEMGGAQYTKLDARSQPTVDGRAYGKAHGTL